MFYTFDQNNSGGAFIDNHKEGISHFVIIEADNIDEAVQRAKSIGLYFDGVEMGLDCSCCGDRWNIPYDSTGTEAPEVYGHEATKEYDSEALLIKWMDGPEGYIHYLDGRQESFWETEKEVV